MSNAFDAAVRLLTRREHGAQELIDKLKQKGYNQQDSAEALAKCQQQGMQSDYRFAELLCRTRITQGYGPIRICQELQAKKINSDLIDEVVQQEQDNWLSYAQTVWQKKFKSRHAIPFAELQKQRRFLMYRGFPNEIIIRVCTDD